MADLAPVLNKKYKLASSENFDEVMKALGVGWMTRKVGGSVSPVIELTESEGVYTLTSASTFKNTEIKFKFGEEFDEETPDGRKVKSIITQEGTKLIHVQKGEKDTTIVREFSPEEVKMVITVDDIVSTRIYKVLP
ncbi:fatty acid-binding protein, muscle-like [Homalodisca vitripennis]|uniref:Fatty acid-binding protein, muscle n=1 Tax=Homalodisca liturata TaxID=320908 RepID=A0A1B6H6S1_9HEMI|nr:fatty acid-binding protein, muscle-like [Homalodisca vitripennis]KAG8280311.1 regulation of retrograde trans-synaptic signaling by endocanabinoid [Homalodisca vitripennis]